MTAGPPEAGGPSVRLEPLTVRAHHDALGQWDIAWNVRNLGAEPLLVSEVWLPHGRFRVPRQRYNPPITIKSGGAEAFFFTVAVDEGDGVEVENGFVILGVFWREELWRIFARVRVTFQPDGTPRPSTESYSVQRIGFSG